MAEEELELDVNQAKGSKTTTILIVIIAVLVLVMGGVGAWLFLGSDEEDSSGSAKKEEKVLGPLKYLTLVPEFIVNFGPGSKVRYLQVDLQIATRDEAALETISTYRPVIRNDILIILSSVKFEDLKERSGKEVLQKKLLNTINKVVVSAGHAAPAGENKAAATHATNDHGADIQVVQGPIENVYFTSFIMQ
ncbi:MAG: flagellar basal body-associated FliL family protein [Gammaproteobacteria bacterium]|nr:flagellar basal body-associated FliL family protein [Gammaproteobacteria bacterium]